MTKITRIIKSNSHGIYIFFLSTLALKLFFEKKEDIFSHYSLPGHFGLLLPPRVGGEGHPRDHHPDGPHLLHEHGGQHDAAVLPDAPHRHLLLLHHDHGGQLRGRLHPHPELPPPGFGGGGGHAEGHKAALPAVAALGAQDIQAGEEDHQELNQDGEYGQGFALCKLLLLQTMLLLLLQLLLFLLLLL